MEERDDDLDTFEEERGRLTLNDALTPGPIRDRLRLQVISLAETEARKQGMDVSPLVMSALVDLTVKFTAWILGFIINNSTFSSAGKTELLARDIEMFAQHAGRKSVNMDDVILFARRNEDVVASLKVFSQELVKGKEQQMEKKRKKAPAKGETSFMEL